MCVPLPKDKRIKLSSRSLAARALAPRVVLLWCFDFVDRLTGFLSFGDLFSSAFHSHWLTQLMDGGIGFLVLRGRLLKGPRHQHLHQE